MQQWQKSLDRCSTSGGQLRVRVLIDWYLSTRLELGLVVERRLCNPAPVVRVLCLAPSCVVGTQGVPLLGHCRNPLLVTTGKYHLSIDFHKSIDISRDMRAIEKVDFSSITLIIFLACI